MENKSSKLNIRIEPTEREWLEKYAEINERSIAFVARLAIRDFIKAQSPQKRIHEFDLISADHPTP